MIIESICIVFLLLLIIFLFLRQKKYDYAKSTFSLIVVPLGNLIATIIAPQISKINGILRVDVIIIGNVVALIVSCLLLGFMATKIKSKKNRVTYLVVNGLFVAILTLVFIYNLLFL